MLTRMLQRVIKSIPASDGGGVKLRRSLGQTSEQRTLEPQTVGVLSEGDCIEVNTGDEGASFLVLAARPLREPVVQYGPFVMNTREEIEQAIADYRNGQMA